MEHLGQLVKERFDRIVIENEMMKAGFAALPYQVLRDKTLSVGARLTYAFLLMYAWQEGSTFAGQQKMAEAIGVSERHLRRYLTELRDSGYIRIERRDKRFNNTYIIVDRKATKLKKKAAQFEADRTPVSGLSLVGR
jgi:biotin operon repressor